MAYSLDDMASWSPDQVLAAIKRDLPAGWTLDYGYIDSGRGYYAQVDDGEGKQQWFDEHGDAKFLFLDLLGWLLYRDTKAAHPVWERRRGEVDPNKTHGSGQRPQNTQPSADPEDLSPSEVTALYEKMKRDGHD